MMNQMLVVGRLVDNPKVEKTEQGYIGDNTYSNSKGPDSLGTSIEDFLKKRKYFGAVYFGINKGCSW